jgi:5-hydroxyisourate hydrolase-like protein (transthyretin family)
MVAFGLVWGAPAFAGERVSKAGSTSAGYSFTTDLTYHTIYVYPSGQPRLETDVAERYPARSTLTVAVKDAAGKPAAGVPVAFEVPQNSMLQGMLDITPKQTTTGADGKVQVTIEPSTSASTGTGDLLVRVGDTTETVAMTLAKSRVPNSSQQ